MFLVFVCVFFFVIFDDYAKQDTAEKMHGARSPSPANASSSPSHSPLNFDGGAAASAAAATPGGLGTSSALATRAVSASPDADLPHGCRNDEYARQQRELLSALGQLEYERSRANYMQAKVLHEEGARWQAKLDAHKQALEDEFARERRAFRDATLLKAHEERELRARLQEATADLETERALARKREQRADGCEEEVRRLVAEVERLSHENQRFQTLAHEASRRLAAAQEEAERLRARDALAEQAVSGAAAEAADLRRRLRAQDGLNARLERSLADVGAASSLSPSERGGGGGGSLCSSGDERATEPSFVSQPAARLRGSPSRRSDGGGGGGASSRHSSHQRRRSPLPLPASIVNGPGGSVPRDRLTSERRTRHT